MLYNYTVYTQLGGGTMASKALDIVKTIIIVIVGVMIIKTLIGLM